MIPQHLRHVLYGGLFLSGVACMVLAYHQHQYTRLLSVGNQSVIQSRFDSQAYTQASRLWWADQKRLLFNQGVLAYKAGNLPQAADCFRRVSEEASNPALRTHAIYNLSVMLLHLHEIPAAVELLKATLRLGPDDTDAKATLEQLYLLALQQHKGSHQQTMYQPGETAGRGARPPLEQVPGLDRELGGEPSTTGRGRSAPRPGI